MTAAKGSTSAHSALVDAVLIKVGALPWFRCWKQVVGQFFIVRWDDRGKVVSIQKVSVGVEGMGDIAGVLKREDGIGVHVEMECKTGGGVQSTAQKARQRMVEDMGGIYLVVRDLSSIREQLEAARKGEAYGQASLQGL